MKKLNRTTAQITPPTHEKILQFGGGNFLRGFIDWMIDVLNKETGFEGSVVVVKPTERGDYKELDDQEGLFHVVLDGLKDGKPVTDIALVESVSRTIHPYRDWKAYIDTSENPEIRFVVSNTTEAGISFSNKDQLDENPPSEFPAKLTRWLYGRFQHFNGAADKGCFIIPCELIENNGELLKTTILKYADLWSLSDQFKSWVINHNYFYNTLVDRIVSGYPEDRGKKLLKFIGFEDLLLVAGEQYHSLILSGDPMLMEEWPFSETNLNVQLVDDITEYRELKVRVLNGAHTSLVPVGYLAGLRTVDESMGAIAIRKFLIDLLQNEVKPTLGFLPEQEVEDFIGDVINRFRNPVLAHQLLDISLNSFSKFKTRLLPTVKAYIETQETPPRRIIFALACLILFYRGEFQGKKIPLRDDAKNLEFARKTWAEYEADATNLEELVKKFLSKLGIESSDKGYNDIVVTLVELIPAILENGVKASLLD